MAKTNARVLPDLSEVMARLQALEAENKALKSSGASVKEPSITLGDFQGHPTVTFDLPGKRPFYLSVNKIRACFEHEAHLKALIKSVKAK